MEYRLISDHQEDLDNGAVVEPGGFIDLDDDRAKLDRAASLIEEGRLVPVDGFDTYTITPEAKKLARDNKVNISAVSGSGDGGKVLVSDVESHIESQKGGTDQ